VGVPTEQDYDQMLNRIKMAMIYSCGELGLLAMGVKASLSEGDADEISSRLRKLAQVLERICTNESDPAPADLPQPGNPVIFAVGVNRG
jgi:hypothetical protein